ncbi:hypothetical protein [Streptacidiphilus anmyonensis]|uniref:hypothetical protein n=1 Tax=Streptacidiphilus anmyonensis TaxID=405782 RepID=UPI0005A674EA|nr:hypothetical protein [Streptacidiphilus anmyonensis]
MRFLEESFVLGALARGRAVEQFLGPAGDAEIRGVRWVEVVPNHAGFGVVLHTSADVGSEQFCDLVEFPPLALGDEEFGREIAEVRAAVDALAIAEARTGAVRDRWVNGGIARDEYRDFVRAGRPDHWPADAT